VLPRHAMLVITRTVFDIVQIPGQQPLVVAKDAGDEAARQWWDGHVRAAGVFDRSGVSWDQRLADWQAATKVQVGKERLHDGGPRVEVARITFPDGTDGVADPEVAHDYITEEFRARFPQPTAPAQFADWRETVQIGDLYTWAGWLYQGGERMPVDIGLPAAEFGYPIREVLACLDRLAADGWRIVHVSEDRAGHPPDSDGHEPGVSTVRYLLSQPWLAGPASAPISQPS
jgi:hypothetical protein